MSRRRLQPGLLSLVATVGLLSIAPSIGCSSATTDLTADAGRALHDAAVLDAAALDAAALDATSGDARLEDATPGDARLADAAPRDAMTRDASPADAAPRDAEAEDAAPRDAEAEDAGPMDTGPRGTCTSSADCGGEACLVVPSDPAGWHTCAGPARTPATACIEGDFNACCSSADCTSGTGGACYGGPLFYCGGPPPRPGNVCVYEECAADADCREGPAGAKPLCVVARAFGELGARCTYGDCRLDGDCTSRAGGRCLPFMSPCNGRLEAFACTYDDSECRTDADCTSLPMGYCMRGDDGHTRCDNWIPPP